MTVTIEEYDKFLDNITKFTNLLLDCIIMQYEYQGLTFETAKEHGSMFLWYFMGLVHLDKEEVLECYNHDNIFKHIHKLLKSTYPYYDDSYLMQIPDEMPYNIMKVLYPLCEYDMKLKEEYANVNDVDWIAYDSNRNIHPLLYWLSLITTFNKNYFTVESIGYIYEYSIDKMEVLQNMTVRINHIQYSKGLYNIYILESGGHDAT